MLLPRSRGIFWLVIAIWWLAAPFVEGVFYTEELRRGAYPTDADSISIPIIQHALGWLMVTPILAAVLVWASRPFPSTYSLFHLNRKLVSLGVISWAITALFVGSELWFVQRSVVSDHWLDAVYSLASCYVALVVNALLQSKSSWRKPSNPLLNTDARQEQPRAG
jgi:hypothetical protein